MRHRIKKIKLSRDYDHRRRLINNLVSSFFKKGRIESSKPKILAAQRAVENLLAKGVKGELGVSRELFKVFQDQKRVQDLKNIFFQLKDKKSGFTRIRKVKIRKGDGSLIYRLEFSQPVSFPGKKQTSKKEKQALKADNKKKGKK